MTKFAFRVFPLIIATLTGCAAKTADLSQIHRPERASQLDAFNVFVGDWEWQAEMTNADAAHRNWTGTAKWQWTLDQRCLHGMMSSKSGDIAFDAAGVWSWDPYRKEYIYWMANNWGFPQEGTADYDDDDRSWVMTYRSIGLDGTPSEGEYRMTVVDNNTLKWEMTEWTSMRLAKKIEMKGTYTRRS